MKELFRELTNELARMSITELEIFKREWTEDLESREMPEKVIIFCREVVDLVIEKKREKEGIVA